MYQSKTLTIRGAKEHNLKNLDLTIIRGQITVITGVSGSGKSSLAFDTILMEARRRFLTTLPQYSRQFMEQITRPRVESISGLSPAVALKQNENAIAKSSKVGSATDLFELYGLLMSRYGEKSCPQHQLPLGRKSNRDLIADLMSKKGMIVLSAPIVQEKKGSYQRQILGFAEQGYTHIIHNGAMVELAPLPQLERDQKHSIDLVIDVITVKEGADKRLLRALELAFEKGNGFAHSYRGASLQQLDYHHPHPLGGDGSCPQCQFTWPRLDPRWFSPNSLGACQACGGYGVVYASLEQKKPIESTLDRGHYCDACLGTGLRADLAAIKYQGQDCCTLYQLSLSALTSLAHTWIGNLAESSGESKVLKEIIRILNSLEKLKLQYLPLARPIRDLSQGEWQKIRMHQVLSTKLTGLIYLFDEPSQGLGTEDLKILLSSLAELKKDGSTIIVVDHDLSIMQGADRIIDMGPGGGADGGQIIADFRPKDASKFAGKSLTAKYLANKQEYGKPQKRMYGKLEFMISPLRNLKIKSLQIGFPALTVVHGPTGAGKTSLLIHALPQAFHGKKIQVKAAPGAPLPDLSTLTLAQIDRTPIAKSSVSMPATYLEVLQEIRDLFGKLPEAQVAGLSAKDFSLSTGEGRCKECQGRGFITLTMRYLEDAQAVCPSCEGKRFQDHILNFTYRDLNVSEILNLTLAETAKVFANHPRIKQRLDPALKLGLGYLKLGQATSTLSGGEAQRLKLVPYFSRRDFTGIVLLLDEPTTGLHFADCRLLLEVFREIVSLGGTVIVADNDPQLMQGADDTIELGPGSGPDGGLIVGSPLPWENLPKETS